MKTTKKLWSMVLCICLCLTMLCTMPTTAQQFGEELLDPAQGAFDGLVSGKEGYIGNWQISGDASVVPYDAADDSETPDSYLKLVATDSTTATATYSSSYLEGKIAPKKTYLVSFRYASETAGQAYIQIYEYPEYEEEKNDSHRINLPSTGGEWKESAFLFTTDASGEGVVNSISLSLNSHQWYVDPDKGGTDTVLFDNVALCEVNTEGADLLTHLAAGTATAEGYAADESGNVLLQLFPSGWTTGDKAVVSGYVKASAGEQVTVSANGDIAGGSSKTFTGTGEWVPFALSGVTYGSNITLAATGNGVEIKGLAFEKDANILQDTTFVTTADGGKWYHSSATDVAVMTDGDCPVGMNYLKVVRSSNQRYASLSGFATHNAGDRYLCSVWYKSDITAAVQIQHKGLESSSPQIDLPATSTWKKIEFVFEMFGAPTGGTVYLWLGIPKGRPSAGTAYFCAPRIEKLSDVKRNGLYAPCGSLMTTTQYEVAEEAATHMQILGESIQSAAGLNEVTAVYIDGVTASTGNVAVAAYTKDANHAKQLSGISISEALPATGVAYPTATLDVSNIGEGTEIRAFLWDGISGLKPLEKAISTTK